MGKENATHPYSKRIISRVTEQMKLENNILIETIQKQKIKINYKLCHLHVDFKIEFIKVTYSGAIQEWMVEKKWVK